MRKFDITFINLPSPFLEDPMWIYPIGLLSLVTYSKSLGIRTSIVDLASLSLRDGSLISNVAKEIQGLDANIIGVSCTTPQSRFLTLFPSILRKKKYCRFIVGGAHPSCLPYEVLSLGFDSIVVGEGEKTLKGFLGFKHSSIVNGEEIENLDDLPFLDRSLVEGYKGPAPMLIGRGCPFRCTFCSKISNKVRLRSPENVFEEIYELNTRYLDKEEIIFYDDTFLQNLEWIEKLCHLLDKSNIKIRFKCSTRADTINIDVARLLKSVGFEEIRVGVESGSQKILNILKKGTTVQQNSLAVNICKKVGLKFKAFIMLGSPGETLDTLKETESWIDKNKPDLIGLYLYTPLPGSDIWNNKSKYDIEFDNKDYSNSYYGGKRNKMFSSVSTSSLSNFEITKFYYYLRKKYDL